MPPMLHSHNDLNLHLTSSLVFHFRLKTNNAIAISKCVVDLFDQLSRITASDPTTFSTGSTSLNVTSFMNVSEKKILL